MDLLRLEHLERRYGRQLAFACDEVKLPAGIVGLLGPNGAGKSTLLRMLLGLLPPSSGRAFVLGLDVVRRSIAVRSRVGYVPEHDAFVPGLTGVEYATLAGELSGLRRREALRRAHEVLDYVGIEEQRYRRVAEYSTGMKQRVKVAQALVDRPELLILDEPTNGLDPAGRRSMLGLIRALHRERGMSVLVSSHLLGDIEQLGDSVVILDRGRVLAHGRVDLLRRERRGRYLVRLGGDVGECLRLLAEGGARCEQRTTPGMDGSDLIVELPSGLDTRFIVDVVARAGRSSGSSGGAAARVLLRELRPDEENLEEIFQRIVGVVGGVA